jgi:hypothetical protein
MRRDFQRLEKRPAPGSKVWNVSAHTEAAP